MLITNTYCACYNGIEVADLNDIERVENLLRTRAEALARDFYRNVISYPAGAVLDVVTGYSPLAIEFIAASSDTRAIVHQVRGKQLQVRHAVAGDGSYALVTVKTMMMDAQLAEKRALAHRDPTKRESALRRVEAIRTQATRAGVGEEAVISACFVDGGDLWIVYDAALPGGLSHRVAPPNVVEAIKALGGDATTRAYNGTWAARRFVRLQDVVDASSAQPNIHVATASAAHVSDLAAVVNLVRGVREVDQLTSDYLAAYAEDLLLVVNAIRGGRLVRDTLFNPAQTKTTAADVVEVMSGVTFDPDERQSINNLISLMYTHRPSDVVTASGMSHSYGVGAVLLFGEVREGGTFIAFPDGSSLSTSEPITAPSPKVKSAMRAFTANAAWLLFGDQSAPFLTWLGLPHMMRYPVLDIPRA